MSSGLFLYNPGSTRKERNHSFHKQYKINLLFSQGRINLQTNKKALGSGRNFQIKYPSPLPQLKILLPFTWNKQYPPALDAHHLLFSPIEHWIQVFLQSPLPTFVFLIYLLKKNTLWVWLFYLGSVLSQLLNKLQILQNTASRAISNCNATTSSKITSGYNTIHMHKLYRLWLS